MRDSDRPKWTDTELLDWLQSVANQKSVAQVSIRIYKNRTVVEVLTRSRLKYCRMVHDRTPRGALTYAREMGIHETLPGDDLDAEAG